VTESGKNVRVGGADLHFRTLGDLRQFIEEEIQRLIDIERELPVEDARDARVWQRIENRASLIDVLLTAYEEWLRSEAMQIDIEIDAARAAIRQLGDRNL
jgi:hypothetical protein